MTNRMYELRERLGLSLNKISLVTGIALATLKRYEDGQPLSTKSAETLARIGNVNPAWLMGWIDNDSRPEPEIIEKIVTETVEKVVYKEQSGNRIPPYFKNDNNGNHIKWHQSVRLVPKKKQ